MENLNNKNLNKMMAALKIMSSYNETAKMFMEKYNDENIKRRVWVTDKINEVIVDFFDDSKDVAKLSASHDCFNFCTVNCSDKDSNIYARIGGKYKPVENVNSAVHCFRRLSFSFFEYSAYYNETLLFTLGEHELPLFNVPIRDGKLLLPAAEDGNEK